MNKLIKYILQKIKSLLQLNSTLEVKIKKTHPDAVIPAYAKQGDAGMDLTAVSMEVVSDTLIKYDLGLAFEIPPGYVGLVYPRSSICKKKQVLTNHVGVIDSGYRGSVLAFFRNPKNTKPAELYQVGERVCQIMIVPYPEVKFTEVRELSSSERDTGSFGSSGK